MTIEMKPDVAEALYQALLSPRGKDPEGRGAYIISPILAYEIRGALAEAKKQ